MTNKDVLMAELSALDDDRLFGVFCNLHNDYCDGCSFNGMHCPVSSSPKFVSSSGWMNRSYPCRNEKVTYQDCANAMLSMWMNKVLSDGEYYRIMDKLNSSEKDEKWNIDPDAIQGEIITCDECETLRRSECIWHNAGATYCSFAERKKE